MALALLMPQILYLTDAKLFQLLFDYSPKSTPCRLVGMDKEQRDSTFQLTWTSAHRARQASSWDEEGSSFACVQLLLLSLTQVPVNYVVVVMVKKLRGRKMNLYDKGLYLLLPICLLLPEGRVYFSIKIFFLMSFWAGFKQCGK